MTYLAGPFLELIWREPVLRRGAMLCVALAQISACAEFAVDVAVSPGPLPASLGVDAGGA